MKLIVDTNIVFSGILNQKSRIGKILIGHQKYFNFYSCNYLKDELKNNFPKLLQLSGKSVEEIEEVERIITRNIRFINEVFISGNSIIEAEELVKDIDFDDVMFVALAKFMGGKLWTGDKKLISGLKAKGFTDIITTKELLAKINEFEIE